MKKATAILLQGLPLLGLAFLLWVHWSISPLNPGHEPDPFGAMVAMYFWGFPFLIITGIALLACKKTFRLSLWSGALVLLYAVPYSLELILKEWRVAPYAYHAWWKAHVYPWTGTFFFITIGTAVLCCISTVFNVIKWNRETSEPAPRHVPSKAAADGVL